MTSAAPNVSDFPRLANLGLSAVLVQFAPKLSGPANAAALAFRAAVEAQGWEDVIETSTSLTSAYVAFDPLVTDLSTMTTRLQTLLATRDWYKAPLPSGRTLWRVPVALGGEVGPQFDEAIALAGVSADQATQQIAQARLRVMAIGFAPGQPYLGELPEAWDIPRQTSLNPQVPAGALVVAVRQLIVFAGPAPTGWRHIGQTGFRPFLPDAKTPIALTTGDEVQFEPVNVAEMEKLSAEDPAGLGGARAEVLA